MRNSKNYIKVSKDGVNISVGVYVFKEGDTFIAYCPSLDLSGYDTTEKKAREDFEFMLTDWLSTQLKNNTLDKDLREHGWKIENKVAEEPNVIDLITKRADFKDIVEMSEYTKTNLRANIKRPDYGYIQA